MCILGIPEQVDVNIDAECISAEKGSAPTLNDKLFAEKMMSQAVMLRNKYKNISSLIKAPTQRNIWDGLNNCIGIVLGSKLLVQWELSRKNSNFLTFCMNCTRNPSLKHSEYAQED